ncbi:hypothetical protein [Deinococcus gobiensis]|uniref:hypothetical protein n=1 Tax=Deinococcus gobiensis TaxID=502394 RepID=UPI0011AE998C|nr:hypothetical protein [Deinococcus gobiensis]
MPFPDPKTVLKDINAPLPKPSAAQLELGRSIARKSIEEARSRRQDYFLLFDSSFFSSSVQNAIVGELRNQGYYAVREGKVDRRFRDMEHRSQAADYITVYFEHPKPKAMSSRDLVNQRRNEYRQKAQLELEDNQRKVKELMKILTPLLLIALTALFIYVGITMV